MKFEDFNISDILDIAGGPSVGQLGCGGARDADDMPSVVQSGRGGARAAGAVQGAQDAARDSHVDQRGAAVYAGGRRGRAGVLRAGRSFRVQGGKFRAQSDEFRAQG
eukprot:313150-Prorocentrum_minimum.AAC.1